MPKNTPTKNPEDPVRLEPRSPRLRIKHFTTEPRRTPCRYLAYRDNSRGYLPGLFCRSAEYFPRIDDGDCNRFHSFLIDFMTFHGKAGACEE